MIAATCLVICLSVTFIGNVEGGKCTRIPHCNSCTYDASTKRATCSECDKLFGLTTVNGFSTCRNCSENTGCLLCKDFTSCDLCRFSNTGPAGDGTATCGACAENCRSCKIAGAGKCDSCELGSKKVGDYCQKCTVENCGYCAQSFDTCATCKPGYFLENNQCTLCDSNCRLCGSAKRCNFCKDKFFLEQDSGSCIPCINNCKTCKDFGKCDECSMGFFLNSMGECAACDDSCLVCSSETKCSYCKQGKPVDGSCKCADNCESCQKVGYGKCDACARGYTQSEGKGCKKIGGN